MGITIGLYRDYYRDRLPHSLLSTREIQFLVPRVQNTWGGARCQSTVGVLNSAQSNLFTLGLGFRV